MKTSHLILAAGLAALPLYGVAAEHTTEAPEASTTRSEVNADGNGEAIFVFDRRDASEDTEAASADHARVQQLRAQARQKVISLREDIQARVQAIRAQMSERLQAVRAEARERAQAIRAEIRD